MEEVDYLEGSVSSVNQESDSCSLPPRYLGRKWVWVSSFHLPGLWIVEWGRVLVGILVGWGSLCSLSEGRTVKTSGWLCALALDLFFVFLNHTAPWVKGVQPAIFSERTCQKEVTLLVCCFFLFFLSLLLARLRNLQDLGSLTRDRTHAPAVEAPSPNHWMAGDFPSFFKKSY